MSSVHLESLEDLREKHSRNRYKRSCAVVALFTGVAILGILFIRAFLHYQASYIDPSGGPGALETSLAVRPDYPVSHFLYDRRTFRWFIGLTANTAITGLAIFGLYTACVSVTAGLGAAACGAAAVGVVGAAIGLISSSQGGQIATTDLELGNVEDVDYVQNGSKRDEDKDEHISHLLRNVLGQDYKFEGHITLADERHAHLVALNGGRPLPVNSFTSPKGTRFHHSMVFDTKRNGLYHRFGFAPAGNDTTVSKRQGSAEPSNEYFSSGGLDLFDCAANDNTQDLLTSGDASNMESLIQCNDPNFGNAKELLIQVYDAVSGLGVRSVSNFANDQCRPWKALSAQA